VNPQQAKSHCHRQWHRSYAQSRKHRPCLGVGVGAIYGLIGDGEILAVKSARRTLVVVDSLHKYAAKLKPAKSDRAIASRNVSVWG